jgi:hypothetical protein
MTPQRLYTIPQLAEMTGQSYEYWDEECRSGRLEFLQPRPGAKRLVAESHFTAWFDRSLAANGRQRSIPRQREPRGIGFDLATFKP